MAPEEAGIIARALARRFPEPIGAHERASRPPALDLSITSQTQACQGADLPGVDEQGPQNRTRTTTEDARPLQVAGGSILPAIPPHTQPGEEGSENSLSGLTQRASTSVRNRPPPHIRRQTNHAVSEGSLLPPACYDGPGTTRDLDDGRRPPTPGTGIHIEPTQCHTSRPASTGEQPVASTYGASDRSGLRGGSGGCEVRSRTRSRSPLRRRPSGTSSSRSSSSGSSTTTSVSSSSSADQSGQPVPVAATSQTSTKTFPTGARSSGSQAQGTRDRDLRSDRGGKSSKSKKSKTSSSSKKAVPTNLFKPDKKSAPRRT